MATCLPVHGLLLLLLLRCSLGQQDACPLEPRPLGGYKRADTSVCSYVQSGYKRNNTKPLQDEIHMELQNITTGVLEVRFLLAPLNFSSYYVQLYVNENASTLEECNNFKMPTSNSQKHSMQEFFNSSCKDLSTNPNVSTWNMVGNNTKPLQDEIHMELQNITTGVLEVRFLLAPLNFSSYYVQLYVNENASTLEECNNFKMPTSNSQKHSMQEFFNSSCKDLSTNPNVSTWNMQGSVMFRHVYLGCYVASVTAKTPTGAMWDPVYCLPLNFSTEYRKSPMWRMSPQMGKQLHTPRISNAPGNKDIRLLIRNFTILLRERLPVELYMRNDSCIFHDDYSNIASWSLLLADNDTLQCMQRKNLSFLRSCDLTANNEGVDCIFPNLAPGNYCVGLKADDPDQCNYSAWTYINDTTEFKDCRYKHNFEVSEPGPLMPPVVAKTGNEDATFIIAGAIIASITILVVVFVIFRSWYKPVTISAYNPDQPELTPSQPQVLLLYAQDCREFMKLMMTFRELLADFNCEVLDCFDSDRLDVAPSPAEWMRCWASKPDVKVVLVASPCAVEHQKALEHSVSLLYRDPLPYSQLFRFGLKEVTHNQQRTYENTFVVRFDDKDLNYITPYTRYVLPLNLRELLKSLNPGTDIKTLSENRSMRKMNAEHANLLLYQRRNPDYILRLMAKLQEAV